MPAAAGLSVAVQTTVPAGAALEPIDLKVKYLRPVGADGRDRSPRGRVVQTGGGLRSLRELSYLAIGDVSMGPGADQ